MDPAGRKAAAVPTVQESKLGQAEEEETGRQINGEFFMEDNNEQPLEVMEPSAIMAMEKAQIDIQIATAHQYPRSIDKFRTRAMSMATLDPETAESCIYTRNVGRELNKATGKWEEKFAEGPSIRLAEIIAVSYGNIRAASKVVEQTERYVKCTGMCHDLESNTAMSADCIEATVTKEGKPYSERQRALIAKVCGAKAIRDAIFKVVPRALCKPVMDAAKKVAQGQDRPLEVRRNKAQAWLSGLKVSDDRVFAALGVTGWSDVTNEHLITLTGIKTAMNDGDETIDSAFPAVVQPDAHKPAETATQKSKSMDFKKEEPKKAPEKTPEGPKETPQREAQNPPQPQNGEPPPAQEAPKAVPATEEFKPRENETPELTEIRRLLHNDGRTEADLIRTLRANKAMRDDQTEISQLSTTKHEKIAKAWSELIKQM